VQFHESEIAGAVPSRAFLEWISALIMLRPERATAG
jgi:hypothetical protein